MTIKIFRGYVFLIIEVHGSAPSQVLILKSSSEI